MSRPRAARSVATSTATRPALKSASARVRAPWLLLPWITATWMPERSRSSPTRSDPRLVRQEHERLAHGRLGQEMRQQRALAVGRHRMHAVRNRGRLRTTWPSRYVYTSGVAGEVGGEARCTSGEKVAEEHQRLPR